MSLHRPGWTLPMNPWNMLDHSQIGPSFRMGGGTNNSMGSSVLGSSNHSSPGIICMPKLQPACQPSAINSMTGFGMNHSQAFGMNTSMSSFDGRDLRENVTGLDSDFPPLVDRSWREEGICGSPMQCVGKETTSSNEETKDFSVHNEDFPALPYGGMVPQPSNEQTQDFSIHNEDFPALPVRSFKRRDSKTNLNSTPRHSYRRPTLSTRTLPSDKTTSALNDQREGIQVLPDGRMTNIPSGMVTDQFGMLGLLAFLQAAETNPGMAHLAMGSDISTLGLDLDSTERLYPRFASPWASAPAQPQDIDFHVHIRDKLPAIKLARYGEDLLFYLYYMHGGELRLQSAEELFNRDWWYHKEERVWITKAPSTEHALKTDTYERGTYYYFDYLKWEKVAMKFHLEYDKLERRPQH